MKSPYKTWKGREFSFEVQVYRCCVNSAPRGIKKKPKIGQFYGESINASKMDKSIVLFASAASQTVEKKTIGTVIAKT